MTVMAKIVASILTGKTVRSVKMDNSKRLVVDFGDCVLSFTDWAVDAK